MQNNEIDVTDRMVRNERRGVWLALIVVIALAATLVMGSDTRRALLIGMAGAIVFAVIWLSQSAARRVRGEIRKHRDAVMHDELRSSAMAAAYKWAFFAVLAFLATFCLLNTVIAFELSAAMLSALTIALGVSVFLGLFLFFDRP